MALALNEHRHSSLRVTEQEGSVEVDTLERAKRGSKGHKEQTFLGMKTQPAFLSQEWVCTFSCVNGCLLSSYCMSVSVQMKDGQKRVPVCDG